MSFGPRRDSQMQSPRCRRPSGPDRPAFTAVDQSGCRAQSRGESRRSRGRPRAPRCARPRLRSARIAASSVDRQRMLPRRHRAPLASADDERADPDSCCGMADQRRAASRGGTGRRGEDRKSARRYSQRGESRWRPRRPARPAGASIGGEIATASAPLRSADGNVPGRRGCTLSGTTRATARCGMIDP